MKVEIREPKVEEGISVNDLPFSTYAVVLNDKHSYIYKGNVVFKSPMGYLVNLMERDSWALEQVPDGVRVKILPPGTEIVITV